MRRILLLCLFASLLNCSYGQILSLKAGPAFSKLEWKNSGTSIEIFNKEVTGFNVTLGFDYLNHRYFNISSNFGFIQKGGAGTIPGPIFQDPDGNSETTLITKLNYLTVNTLFVLKLPLGKTVTPFLQVGPRLDYMVTYSENVKLLGEFSELGHLNKVIYGADFGVGVDFKINRVILGVEFDYLFNFNKIVDYTSESGVTNQISDQTFVLNAQIGYRF